MSTEISRCEELYPAEKGGLKSLQLQQQQQNKQLYGKNEQGTWIDISPKKIHKRPISTWKGAHYHYSLGGMTIKTIIRYYLTPISMAMIKIKTENSKC